MAASKSKNSRWGADTTAGYDSFIEFIFDDMDAREFRNFVRKYNKDSSDYRNDPDLRAEDFKEEFVNTMANRATRKPRTAEQKEQARKNAEAMAEVIINQEKRKFKGPVQKKVYDFNDGFERYDIAKGIKIKAVDTSKIEKFSAGTPLKKRKEELIEAAEDPTSGFLNLSPSQRELRKGLAESGLIAQADLNKLRTKKELSNTAKRLGIYEKLSDVTPDRIKQLNSQEINTAWTGLNIGTKSNEIGIRTSGQALGEARRIIKVAEKTNNPAVLKEFKEKIRDMHRNDRGDIPSTTFYTIEEMIDKAYTRVSSPLPIAPKPKEELAWLIANKRGTSFDNLMKRSLPDLRKMATQEGFGLRNYEQSTRAEKISAIAKQTAVIGSDAFKKRFDELSKRNEKFLDKTLKAIKPPVVSQKDIAVFERDLPTRDRDVEQIFKQSGILKSLSPAALGTIREQFRADPKYANASDELKTVRFLFDSKRRELASKNFHLTSNELDELTYRRLVSEDLNLLKRDVYEKLPASQKKTEKPYVFPVFGRLVREAFAQELGKTVDALTTADERLLASYTNKDYKFKLGPRISKTTVDGQKLWSGFIKEHREDVRRKDEEIRRLTEAAAEEFSEESISNLMKGIR